MSICSSQQFMNVRRLVPRGQLVRSSCAHQRCEYEKGLCWNLPTLVLCAVVFLFFLVFTNAAAKAPSALSHLNSPLLVLVFYYFVHSSGWLAALRSISLIFSLPSTIEPLYNRCIPVFVAYMRSLMIQFFIFITNLPAPTFIMLSLSDQGIHKRRLYTYCTNLFGHSSNFFFSLTYSVLT